ncbi:hypothetical protein MTP99_002490 [Tenebrio molitor]|nr:hypothetical protein MTP99_002490 [Tenebrio molitor]
MSDLVQVGPPSYTKLPHKSLGRIFYDRMKNEDPNETVLVDCTGEEITRQKLLKLSIKMAKQLRHIGIVKGDVITIISPNHYKLLLTVLAGFFVGAQINLLNHDYTLGELKYFMSICQPVLIFCTTKTLDVVVELRDEYFSPTIISYDSETSVHVKNFDDAFDVDCNDRDFNLATLDPKQDVALILTSSGTTGLPKCVQLTHANLRNTMIYAGEASFMDINKRESVLAFLPFFHILGLGTTLASVLYGAKTVILDRFVPERFLGLIEKHKITKLFVVPSVLIFFVKSPLVDQYNVSSIGDVLCASDSLKRELEEMVERRLKIKSVRQIYGLTEVSGAVTVTPKSVKRFGSCGQVQNGFQVKVCDPDTGTALFSGQVGELRVKGDGIMKGYLGCEEETQKVFDREGFLKTGDLGYYDIAGFFYIVDRLKEIIKYKGFQVSPSEIENLLIQHPSVKDVGVVGVADERVGEVPLAFVVKQAGREVTGEELIAFVEKNLSVQKRLYGGVRFTNEIPKNSGGKILRKELKKLL